VSTEDEHPISCPLPTAPDLSNLTVVEFAPTESLPDYTAAMSLANDEAEKRLGVKKGSVPFTMNLYRVATKGTDPFLQPHNLNLCSVT